MVELHSVKEYPFAEFAHTDTTFFKQTHTYTATRSHIPAGKRTRSWQANKAVIKHQDYFQFCFHSLCSTYEYYIFYFSVASYDVPTRIIYIVGDTISRLMSDQQRRLCIYRPNCKMQDHCLKSVLRQVLRINPHLERIRRKLEKTKCCQMWSDCGEYRKQSRL